MATDFLYGGKQIVASGPFKPSGKNMPVDARTRVEVYADIESIPNPFIGMRITVLADETNNNKMTDYIVKSLKANASGFANTVINEVVRYVDYLGVSSSGGGTGEGLTTTQAQQLSAAYAHSQSTHVQPNDLLNIDAVSLNGKKFSNIMTKTEYDAIADKDENTIYLVDDDSSVIGVPDYSISDANKVLAVNSNGTALAWIDVPSGGGAGLTEEQTNKLNVAYTHSQSTHVQSSDIPTKVSQLQNDSNFISLIPEEYVTQDELDSALLNASLGEIKLPADINKITDLILEGNKRIKFIGDSIVDGYGGTGYNGTANIYDSVNNKGYCWVNLFKKLLLRYNCTCVNRGMYGSKLFEQSNSFNRLIDDDDDLVVWYTGTNDRINELCFKEYASDFETKLNILLERNIPVLVINGIPNNDPNEKTDYNMYGISEIVYKACRNLKVPHIDLYNLFSSYILDNKINLTDCLSDYVHPNDLGYYIMFLLIARKLCIPLNSHQSYKYDDYWVNNQNIVNTILPSELTIGVGESLAVLGSTNPINSVINDIKWSSNNNNIEIATNDISCIIKGITAGSSVLTLTLNGDKTANCNVTIQSTPSESAENYNGLVGYWSSDYYKDTILYDKSYNKYNLEMRGNVSLGDKIYFDGNGFGVLSINPTKILTYEFIIEFDHSRTLPCGAFESGIVTTIGASSGFSFTFKNNYYPYVYYRNSSGSVKEAIRIYGNNPYDSSDTKVHLVYRFNESDKTFHIFKNGVDTNYGFSIPTDETTPLDDLLTVNMIGIGLQKCENLGSSLDRVSLYSLKVYSTSLSDEEIINNFNKSGI